MQLLRRVCYYFTPCVLLIIFFSFCFIIERCYFVGDTDRWTHKYASVFYQVVFILLPLDIGIRLIYKKDGNRIWGIETILLAVLLTPSGLIPI
jgi:hypothetical protein